MEYSNTIIISYRTELPKDYLSSSELTKSFSNTASIEVNGEKIDSSFTQEVTRRVVGKSGRYDESTKTLTYEILLNPDTDYLPLTVKKLSAFLFFMSHNKYIKIPDKIAKDIDFYVKICI